MAVLQYYKDIKPGAGAKGSIVYKCLINLVWHHEQLDVCALIPVLCGHCNLRNLVKEYNRHIGGKKPLNIEEIFYSARLQKIIFIFYPSLSSALWFPF